MRTFSLMGSIGVTTKLTSTDTAQALPATILTCPTSGRPLLAATFYVETKSIRIGIGAVPTQAGLGPLLADGDVLRVVGRKNLEGFQFISAASGQHGSMQVVPEY